MEVGELKKGDRENENIGGQVTESTSLGADEISTSTPLNVHQVYTVNI